MKRFAILGLIMMLTLSFSTVVFGAVHSNEGEIFATDTWYTITPETPYWQAGLDHESDADYTGITGEFYKNEQTFANATFDIYSNDESDITEFAGSYLFKSGFFVGMDYCSENAVGNDNDDTTIVSPGYRYNIKRNGYLAVSFDYRDSEGDQGIVALDGDFKYYTKNMKIVAEAKKPEDQKMILQGGLNFKADRDVVLGAKIYDDTYYRDYNVGLTWSPKPFIVDVMLGEDGPKSEEKVGFFATNFMYNVNKHIAFGTGYYKTEAKNDPRFSLNFKYLIYNAKFKFMFIPENDSYNNEFVLAYYSKLNLR